MKWRSAGKRHAGQGGITGRRRGPEDQRREWLGHSAVVFTLDVNIDTGSQLDDALSIITEALQSIKEHLVEFALPNEAYLAPCETVQSWIKRFCFRNCPSVG